MDNTGKVFNAIDKQIDKFNSGRVSYDELRQYAILKTIGDIKDIAGIAYNNRLVPPEYLYTGYEYINWFESLK